MIINIAGCLIIIGISIFVTYKLYQIKKEEKKI